MKYSMYVDDIRTPKGTFDVITRSSVETEEYLIRNGCPTFVSLDHDLGGEDTAMRIVKFIINMDLDMGGDWMPLDFSFNVHSANVCGTKNIEGYLNSYLKQKRNG